MEDLRIGSRVIQVYNNQAKIMMSLEQSNDLSVWSNTSHILEVDIPVQDDVGFFRFRFD